MAVTAVAGVGARPIPRLRRLEDERWLALALLLPFAGAGRFLEAYPVVEAILDAPPAA